MEINGNPKVQCLVNTEDELELPSQAVTVFAWSSKKYAVLGFPGGAVVKNPPASAGDTGSSPGLGISHVAAEQLSLRAATTEPAL